MKKIKQILKILICLFVITLVVILLSLQPAVSFYLSNKSDNKAIIIGVILVIFTTSSITLFFDRKAITEYIKEQMRKVKGNFIWRPSVPIKNNKTTIQLIKNYPRDYKMDFHNFNINGTVEGVEAFKQAVIKFVNTPKNKYKIYEGTNYGTEHSLFTVNSSEEFTRQANSLAEQIVNYYGEWIDKIYCIKKNGNCLIIEMKVYGMAESLCIDIPNLGKSKE
ncbi:MAG TPA: DUF2634 domain-containing protein [Clostridiaceae bacterium]|jgi:hypothetical protein|nr:DUF2634 domain-containing protein [Clostridiaceae bacterium]